jgi:hypothetical protein
VAGEGLIRALEAEVVELPQQNGAGEALVVLQARLDVVGVGIDELVDRLALARLGVRVVEITAHRLAVLAEVSRDRGHGPASLFQIA